MCPAGQEMHRAGRKVTFGFEKFLVFFSQQYENTAVWLWEWPVGTPLGSARFSPGRSLPWVALSDTPPASLCMLRSALPLGFHPDRFSCDFSISY